MDAGGYSVVITNAFGSVTSVVAVLTVIDPLIAIQPLSQLSRIGDSVTFTVGAIGTSPFTYQWRQDGLAIAGATQSSLMLTNLLGSDAGSYGVIVNNRWGSATSSGALLTINLAVADSFNPGVNGEWGGRVHCLAPQPDGKILVGGFFNSLGGQSRTNIGRLNANGTLDTSFNPGANNSAYLYGTVNALLLQQDGKILVGGCFSMLAGQSRTNLARLNRDGKLDSSFNPPAGDSVLLGSVSSLVLQPDGKILVGGGFSYPGNTNIVRLNPDGTLDTSFMSGRYGAIPGVLSMALQSDGKVLVGGYYTYDWGVRGDFGYLIRLNPDGEPDANFNLSVNLNQKFPEQLSHVETLAVQPDQKILVGGVFHSLGHQNCTNIARLNDDGTVDMSFNPGADGSLTSIALQADGKILIGGGFSVVGGQSRSNLARLNPDGTVDPAFNPGHDGYVLEATSLALQADEKLLVGGSFTRLAGQARADIGRLENIGLATQSLSFNGSTLTWKRGGTSPEVWPATFEYSTDGSSWTNLGAGVRIPGGWHLTGLAVPANARFRAQGYTTGGSYNGSSWFVETVWPPALAISHLTYSPAGQIQFNALGGPGQIVIIEASPDLRTWTPLRTNTLGTGPLSFSDPQPARLPSRFFRLRSGP